MRRQVRCLRSRWTRPTSPQTPVELLIILAAIADEQIPIQTIAPKFTGRFNKGVDYVGDVAQFTKEFEEDLAAIAFAIQKRYSLPDELEAQRALRLGQVFDLFKAIYEGGEEVRCRRAFEDRRNDLARRADRAWRKPAAIGARAGKGSVSRGLRSLRRAARDRMLR